LTGAAVEARRAAQSAAHAADQEKRLAAESKALSSTEGAVDPVAVAATLRELITDDAVAADETITHSRVIARHLMAGTAGRYSYVQGGLGQGLGVALGAKLGLGGRLTVLRSGTAPGSTTRSRRG
jgi:acetolactate synthase I/II/III large subunit